MHWVPEGDHQRCTRHGASFGKLETCPACEADPGPPIGQIEPELSDPEARADETWCRAQRDALIALAGDLAGHRAENESKDRIGYSTVAKLYDTALKFHRAAVEERRSRGERDHERWLVKQYRELGLARHGVSN